VNIRNATIVTLAAIMLLLALPVWSANVADLTSDTRLCPVPYYKTVYDDGPWYGAGIEPIGKDMSLLAMNWNSKDSVDRLYELALTRRLKKGVDVAYIYEWWQGTSCTQKGSVMLDLSRDNVGLGIIAPLQNGHVKFGPRLTAGHFTGYMTLEDGCRPARGISYFGKKGLELDLAYMGETWYFRASKPVGKFIPELRTRFTKEENFVGFGLAYCPN